MKNICVFCGSSNGISDTYDEVDKDKPMEIYISFVYSPNTIVVGNHNQGP